MTFVVTVCGIRRKVMRMIPSWNIVMKITVLDLCRTNDFNPLYTMDDKEKTKDLCSSFFHAFRALETVKDDLSVIIMGIVLDAFHYDGLLSSVQNDDIRVVFESDGNNDGDITNADIAVWTEYILNGG